MKWTETCVKALTEAGLFENAGHRTRFKEMLDCFSVKPFFTKGLCKCMYLSAWDEEHFAILLSTLTHMDIGKDEDTSEMRFLGDSLAEEQANDESYIYRLSISFLEDSPFVMDKNVPLSERTAYVIRRALQAAEVIDIT